MSENKEDKIPNLLYHHLVIRVLEKDKDQTVTERRIMFRLVTVHQYQGSTFHVTHWVEESVDDLYEILKNLLWTFYGTMKVIR